MFHDAVRIASDNWPLLLGAFAAVLTPAWLAYLLRGRRRVRTLRDKVAGKFGGTQNSNLELMLNWLPQEADHERRRALRRVGPPTAIRITAAPADDPATTPNDEGLVLDRGIGGLCFAVERQFRSGEEVFLRVEGAEPDFPWVAVTVRHCRDCGEFFLVGCEFRESLPLNVRLQFG